MKTNAAVAVLEVGRVDGGGRRLVRRRERMALLAAYGESALTQRAFAEREGINFYTFCNWLRKSRRADPAVGAGAGPRFLELPGLPGAGFELEVALPGGTIVRGRQAAATAELVRALR